MHISDALMSAPVALPLWGATIGTAAYAIKKVNLEENTEKLPLIGVMGAFTFAAQMINFAIPGTGASGHLAGGLLLAILLGPHLAFLTMMSLLLIQALFFGDGGLIAYGANVFNMGIVVCYGIYPLVYLPIKSKLKKSAILISACVGGIVSALSVVLEISLSGTIDLSFLWFLVLMVVVHAVIGLLEGGITYALVAYLKQYMPDKIEKMQMDAETSLRPSKLFKSLGLMSMLLAGLLSYYASAHPDGLEWSLEKALVSDSIGDRTTALQALMSKFLDYQMPMVQNERLSVGIAGIIGILITYTALSLLRKYFEHKKIKSSNSESECTDV